MRRHKNSKFRAAILEVDGLASCIRDDLEALSRSERKCIEIKGCQGSVNIDCCLREYFPNANRWDYVVGSNNKAFFIEFHRADTNQINVVINKLQWLRDWLNSNAQSLNNIRAREKTFVWIPTGKNNITSRSSYARRVAQAGLLLTKNIQIP